MDKDIFIGTLLYKNIISDEEYIFNTLGPMMGTIDGSYFINTNDREYLSIDNDLLILDRNKRYGFYNMISLYDAKIKYNSSEIENIISKYLEEYKNISFYVYFNNGKKLIVRFKN